MRSKLLAQKDPAPKSKDSAGDDSGAAARPCPICGKPAVAPFEPFCSSRCRDVDLHRWLSGSYAIPVVEEDGTEEEGDAADEETGRTH